MRTTERACTACAKATTHEIVGAKMGEYSFACLRCRELDAEAAALADKTRRSAEVERRANAILGRPAKEGDPAIQAEIAANKANNRIRDGAIITVCIVGAVGFYFFTEHQKKRDREFRERTVELHGREIDGNQPMERLIGETERLRDRMCACATFECKDPIMTNRIRLAADSGGAIGNEGQRLRLERVEQQFNECYTRADE